MNKILNLNDFSELFGTIVDDFDEETREFINKTNFTYRALDAGERDATILGILRRIESGNMPRAGKSGKTRWEIGWAENLKNFIEADYNPTALVPKYVRPNQVLRLRRNYIMPGDDNMELNVFTVIRLWLFKKYLKNFQKVYEFGCGTGYNLLMLAALFPDLELNGLDWSTPVVKILNLLQEKKSVNITGHLFDMFTPDYNLSIDYDCAAMTIGGLEQLGVNHREFTEFLLKKCPKLCIHLEPIYELYDENNLVDYLAMKFHKKRNYLMNYLNDLRRLERDKKIEILKVTRMLFGSLFHDGWSIIIWRPL